MKRYGILLTLVVLLLGCRGIDEGSEVITELAAKIPPDLASNRGDRNCELFDLGLEDGQVVINVWNNVGQGHECPDDWLASIDRDEYLVDGPRWRPIDYGLMVDDDLNLVFDENALNKDDPVVREIPEGSGITLVRAATIDIGPVRRITNQFDITMDGSGNVPPELSQAIFAQFDSDTSYTISEINRAFNTFWVYQTGQPVYVLSDGECEYAMKYYTSAQNPALTSEDAIADLNNLFEEIPPGYSFEVRFFSENVHVLDLDGFQYVMNDEFGNSYDRLWCGESQVSYTVKN